MASFIHLVADYGAADPAFSEVVHRLHAEDPNVTVQPTAVPAFSTVATGFWIEQLGLHNPPFDGCAIYSNTAPRVDPEGTGSSDGGPLCYAELDTGVPVVAVDAGYNLSFVRDRIVDLRTVEVTPTDSQFRSRDVFPGPVVSVLTGDPGPLGPRRPIGSIPEPPEAVVCHVDGYGNIKTSIRASSVDLDRDLVDVEVGSVSATVSLATRVSDLDAGTLGFVPGSAGGDYAYNEFFLRGGSAAAALGEPEPGDAVVGAR